MRSLQLLAFGTVLSLAACGSEGIRTPDGSGGGDHPPGGTGDQKDAGTDDVTWYRDVLPIVQKSCHGCHLEGGIGPFALSTYAEVSAMHTAVASAVENRRMPPWMPDESCNSYLDERRLTQSEIDTIVAWSKANAPEGDPADAPPPPAEKPGLPWVDATLDPGFDYTPPSGTSDDYHCFILDPAHTSTKDVIGFDIVPGVRRMVHHVLLYSADKTDAVIKDANTPEPGWTCFGGPGTPNPQVVGGWVPGSPVTQYPEGTGIRLQSGKVLVMQIHYNTAAGPVADRTTLKLQYAKTPVTRPALIVPQAEANFAIPPNSTGYSVTNTSVPLPSSVKVHGVLPHMHTLGRSMKVTLASGECLVDIPKWDFHWQQFYMLKEPITAPAGAQSVVTCRWDNPTGNTVRWGEGTSDEMCINYYYVTHP